MTACLLLIFNITCVSWYQNVELFWVFLQQDYDGGGSGDNCNCDMCVFQDQHCWHSNTRLLLIKHCQNTEGMNDR